MTIVLIGQRTWQRKHVDWEISASLMDTEHNPRCGLIGILLPTHPDHGPQMQEPTARLIPPRLADNISGGEPFAAIYNGGRRTTRRQENVAADSRRRSSVGTARHRQITTMTCSRTTGRETGW